MKGGYHYQKSLINLFQPKVSKIHFHYMLLINGKYINGTFIDLFLIVKLGRRHKLDFSYYGFKYFQ